jgi:uncharacterized protein
MAEKTSVISPEFIQAVKAEFALGARSIHGEGHWERVRANGLRLAEATGADVRVVEYFAFLHDSKRENDSWDPGHGERGAMFATTVRDSLIQLDDAAFWLLYEACRDHTEGLTEADVTVQTCWDADRLDLGRANIRPKPSRLCTDAARDPEVLEWAYRRSLSK